jgi:hypothetical protein
MSWTEPRVEHPLLASSIADAANRPALRTRTARVVSCNWCICVTVVDVMGDALAANTPSGNSFDRASIPC